MTAPPEKRFDFEPTEDPHVFRVHVRPDLVFFRGHFEEMAILPAVVQLSCVAMPIARKCWPDLKAVRGVRRLRFRRPIFPGSDLAVKVERDGARISFAILIERQPGQASADSVEAASGSLLFADEA